MFNFKFYHGTIRRYVIYFGTLFNQIYIDRTDASGNITSTIRVPITYGPKDKVLSRVSQDPNLDRPFASVLPYLSFQMTGMHYDPDRHLNSSGRQPFKLDSNKDMARYLYNPVAFNFDFELNIMVKNLEDGSKIIEQILPFFTPDWTATLRIIDDPEILRDIPVIYDSMESTDTWDGQFNERRYITHKLKFLMKAYFFGPVEKHRIIKFVDVHGISTDGYGESDIHVYPGLTIDGLPTDDPALTVPYSNIEWTDDYGIITTLNGQPHGNTHIYPLDFSNKHASTYVGQIT